MTASLNCWVAAALLVFGGAACGDDSDSEVSGGISGQGPQTVVTRYTDWPIVGTVQKPTYGGGCRYRATDGEVWSLNPDGANDQVQLDEAQAGDVVFQAAVIEAGSLRLTAYVEFERALVARSFDAATGSVSWGEGDELTPGVVVDGSLCFERKLDEGPDPIRAEFSLIVENEEGPGYVTIGGQFSLMPNAISSLDPITVIDQAIEVDLR